LHGGAINSVAIIGQKVCATTSKGIYASSDHGKTWNSINGGIIDTVYPAFVVQSGSNFIVASQDSGKVFLSSDGGETWGNVGKDLPSFVSLTVSGSNIVAGSRDGVYVSTDGGETWNNTNDTLMNINTLTTSGLYLFGGRYHWPYTISSPPSPPGGVFRSSDGGLTWSTFSSGIPFNPQVHTIAAHGDDVFAGSDPGLYTSHTAIDSWVNIGSGLPEGTVLSLFVNDSSVFVGEVRGGIWRARLSEVTGVKQPLVSAKPTLFHLEQNYPNPFNPSTTISYELSEATNVKLSIYDVLGRHLVTLLNAKQNSGNHKVVFDAGKFASGVYFYKLETQNYVAIRKMLVIK